MFSGLGWIVVNTTRHSKLQPLRLAITSLLITFIVSACNSSGNSPVSNVSTGPATTTYTAGVFAPSANYANLCAKPRTGIDPSTNKAYLDRTGTATLENFWLRSWTHELYLWYKEAPDLNPNNYTDPVKDYFPLLKTSAKTASGNDKDKFHFTWDTAQWNSFSGSGQSAGYGAEFAVINGSPPRLVVIAYIDPNTPAATAGLSRGQKLITVDGVDVTNGSDVTTLNNGTFPSGTGQNHTFVLLELDGVTQRTVTLTSANVTSTPVQRVGVISGTNGQVGYMQFNDHIAPAEQQFITAVNTLKTANITDLVLDLRYNGGGLLDLASEIGYMIAGSSRTSGKVFEKATFNDQYSSTINPVTSGSNPPTPFLNTAQGFSATAGTALPTLNLSRIFILTGPGTCSASEAVINSLRGVNVQVIQVGSTTCGKPYGFYPQDNCGTTYFSIELKGTNDAGFGDYTDGFSPANSTLANSGVSVPGCSIADDFTHQLGDPFEGRLAAALFYRTNNTCPAGGPTGTSSRAQIQSVNTETVDLSNVDGHLFKHPWRENRIMRK